MVITLIVIATIVVLLLIVALISGKEMIIERMVEINKPLAEVFDYVKFVRNQDNFSVWNMADPERKKEFQGVDGNIGFIYSWDSPTNKNVGAGEQEITGIVEGKQIDYEIRFFRPMENVAKASFVFTAVSPGQTNVLWGFYSKTKFPMRIMKALFQKMLGKDLEKSLQNLKKLLEEK